MPTTTDLLGLAIDKNPVDFADTFNQIMMQKAHDALENRRVEVAQSIYGEDSAELEDDAVDFEDDDIDLSDDEDDLDLDLDDLDIDLDDLDLEGIIDDEDA